MACWIGYGASIAVAVPVSFRADARAATAEQDLVLRYSCWNVARARPAQRRAAMVGSGRPLGTRN